MADFIIGIPSYFPDHIWEERKNRFETFINYARKLFPGFPIVVIAQNWKGYRPADMTDINVFEYPKLGIVGARSTLLKELKKFDFTWCIFLDDDAIIYGDDVEGFLSIFKGKTSGYCFRNNKESLKLLPFRYMPASLNLCVISKDLLEANPIDIRFDPEQVIAYEDVVWPLSFFCLWQDKEIHYPIGTIFTSFNYGQSISSTWMRGCAINYDNLWYNTENIVRWMYKHKRIPDFTLDNVGRVVLEDDE